MDPNIKNIFESKNRVPPSTKFIRLLNGYGAVCYLKEVMDLFHRHEGPRCLDIENELRRNKIGRKIFNLLFNPVFSLVLLGIILYILYRIPTPIAVPIVLFIFGIFWLILSKIKKYLEITNPMDLWKEVVLNVDLNNNGLYHPSIFISLGSLQQNLGRLIRENLESVIVKTCFFVHSEVWVLALANPKNPEEQYYICCYDITNKTHQ